MATFKNTTATKKIFQLKKRIRAVRGGTAASKTISILVWLIDYCQSAESGRELCSVVSESFPHLSMGAMRDFEAIMKDRGYWDEDRWVKSPRPHYMFETGNELEFISIDSYGKAHGPRRDVLFINECNNLDYKIVDQLITRTRKIVWLDWNPVEEFWFDTEMLGKRDDIDFITLTYLDNEGLDEVTRAEIESHKNNKNWWNVYGLGLPGATEARIYKNWQIIDEVPLNARLWRNGLDFGYTNDPSTSIDIYEYDGGYILDEIFYQKGLSNKQIADYILNKPSGQCLVIADSAEPKSIDELRSYKVSVMGATKTRDSVLQGIQFIQDKKISVTKRSVNLIREYRNYQWITDKDGKILNEPEHAFSHSMDAIRYGFNGNVIKKTATIVAKPYNY